MKRLSIVCASLFCCGASVTASYAACPTTSSALLSAFTTPTNVAGNTAVGGLWNGARMWAAVVDRDGNICAVASSTTDPKKVWPGSLAIAKAKAYTANAFSNDLLPLSTARLYTFTQPGHSLNSLGQSNLFNSYRGLQPPSDPLPSTENGKIDGGLIFFGGGLPLYDTSGNVVGGLGLSGDTACADHEVAKGVRANLGLVPPGGNLADDIVYTKPSSKSVFGHPRCLNTKLNGKYIGEETPAVYDQP